MVVAVAHRVVFELWLSWRFVRSDVTTGVLPALLFIIGAWADQHGALAELPALLGRGAVYFWLFLLSFCIGNQVVGMDEDRHNKPARPLPRGIVSLRGAQRRWAVSTVLLLMVGFALDVLPWALLWMLSATLHNYGGWARHWLGKNVAVGIGVLAQLAAAWELAVAGPITSDAWRWIVGLSAVVAALVGIQDLRDIAGDHLIGRRTLPLVFGEWPTRWALAAGFVLLPVFAHVMLFAPHAPVGLFAAGECLLTLLSLWIAVRILRQRLSDADHHSYLLFTIWYCGALLYRVLLVTNS